MHYNYYDYHILDNESRLLHSKAFREENVVVNVMQGGGGAFLVVIELCYKVSVYFKVIFP